MSAASCRGPIPRAQEIVEHAAGTGRGRAAEAVRQVVDGVLSRPEHLWFTAGAAGQAARIRDRMRRHCGDAGR